MLAERAKIKRGGNPRDEPHGERAAVWELKDSSPCGAEPVFSHLPVLQRKFH